MLELKVNGEVHIYEDDPAFPLCREEIRLR